MKNALKALEITLTKKDLERIEKILPKENAKSDYMPVLRLAENGLFSH